MAIESSAYVVPKQSFEQRLKHLERMAKELPRELSGVEDLLRNISLTRVAASLDAARIASKSGRGNEAWGYLIDAAEALGKLHAWVDARKYFTTKQCVKELLRKNGRKGGLGKGINSSALRDVVVTALVKIAPKGGWASIEEFDQAYYYVALAVPKFKTTEYQRARILERTEIKKLVRSKEAMRDDVVAALVELAPESGWLTKDDASRDFEAAAKKVADFKPSRKQRQMVMRRPEILELFSPKESI